MADKVDPWTDRGGAFGHAFARAAISQTFSALYWLGQLFSERTELRACVELGTLNGACSTFFGLSFPGSTHTCDLRDHRSAHTKELHQRLGVAFIAIDLLHDAPAGRILDGLPHPLLLFCDNGDKEREFLSFLPHLLPGDVIAVHDYRTSEFDPEKPEIAEAVMRLKPWRQDELDADTTYLGIWAVP